MTALIKEGLKAGDLDGLVDKNFEVDRHKSKMGDDKDVCVLAFTVTGLEPAKDLERFAEKGYKSILDADATPGTMQDGKHKVFVEFQRVEKMDTAIFDFLEDLKKLCNVQDWTFTYHKKPVKFEASKANLSTVLPRTPEAYNQKINQLELNEPLQHVIGNKKIFGINFKLNDSVLIPRPETEELCSWILSHQLNNIKILDIGTGSGLIALVLKKHINNSTAVSYTHLTLPTNREV